MEWIQFIEWSQKKINGFSAEKIDELYKILFENYNSKKWNLIKQMKRNMWEVEKILKKESIK